MKNIGAALQLLGLFLVAWGIFDGSPFTSLASAPDQPDYAHFRIGLICLLCGIHYKPSRFRWMMFESVRCLGLIAIGFGYLVEHGHFWLVLGVLLPFNNIYDVQFVCNVCFSVAIVCLLFAAIYAAKLRAVPKRP